MDYWMHHSITPTLHHSNASFRLPCARLFSFTDSIRCRCSTMKIQTTNSRHGLLSGGNWIVDQVKLIDVYPQPEQLGNIRAQSQGTGGAPYNVLVDLAKSGAPFPLYAAGLVGRDALGEQILADCRQRDIDIGNLAMTSKAP